MPNKVVCFLVFAGSAASAAVPAPTKTGASEAQLSVGQAQPSGSFSQLVTTLKNVLQSVQEEEKQNKALLTEKKSFCKSTLAEKKKSINDATRTIDQAKADLEEFKADAKDGKENIKSIKTDMAGSNDELDKLQSRLSRIRGKFEDKRKKMEEELDVLQKGIDKGKRASLSQFSHEFDTPSFDSDASFLQTHAVSKGPNVKALKADRDKLDRDLDGEREDFNKEEGDLLALIREERAKLKKLEDNLADAQPTLAETQEKISETTRKITSSKRSKKRDLALRKSIGNECDRYMSGGKMQTSLRNEQQQQLKMAIKLLQTMGGSFLQADMDDVNGTQAVNFVQTRMRTRSNEFFDTFDSNTTDVQTVSQESTLGLLDEVTSQATSADPFEGVKKMIQMMIEQLKAANNKDGNQQKYCDEQMSKNRRERQVTKNDLDVKKAEVLNHKHAIERFEDSVTFFTEEMQRMQKEMAESKVELDKEKEKVKTETQDHLLAIKIIDQSIHVLKTICELSLAQTPSSGARVFLEAGAATNQRGQCGEVVSILGDAKAKFKEQNNAAKNALMELEELSDKAIGDAQEAIDSKKREKQTAQNTISERGDAMLQAQDDIKALELDLSQLGAFKGSLEKQCGPNIVDKQDKIDALNKEIEALKEALKVLEGDAIPGLLQQKVLFGAPNAPASLQRAAEEIGVTGSE